MKTVALIPIRKGSKGIPNKNMKMMCGKPLCYWVIEAALGAKSIDHVYYSTDYDEERWQIEGDLDYGKLDNIVRPDWLATDTASSDDVLRHFCWSQCEPDDHVVMLQATSPLTTSDDIDRALELFEDPPGVSTMQGHWASTVVSVVDTPRRLYWSGGEPVYNLHCRPRRESVEEMHMENGAIYISHVKRIMKDGARVNNWAWPYIMHPDTATEVDTPEDWDIVEKLLEARLS